jgi:hypothetical protein
MNKIIYNKMNKILIDWDPIGVGLPLSKFEYQGYIPKIYKTYVNNGDLKKVLLSILQDDLCLEVYIEDKNIIIDLEDLISKLKKVMSNGGNGIDGNVVK